MLRWIVRHPSALFILSNFICCYESECAVATPTTGSLWSVELEYVMDMKSCQDACKCCDIILTYNACFFPAAIETCVSQCDTRDISLVRKCFCNGIKETLHTLVSLVIRGTDRSHKIMHHSV